MPFERFEYEGDESVDMYRHTNGRTNLTLTKPQKLIEDNPTYNYFIGALDSLGELLDKEPAIHENTRLSTVGKNEKIEPLRTSAVNGIARVAATMDKYEGTINAREAKLLGVPELTSGDAGGGLIDREIREYFRSQPAEVQNRLISSMKDGPEHVRIELALLRSPIALVDHQTRLIRESWDRRSRLANPAEAFDIENARAAIDWARAGLGHVAGMTRSVTGWGADQLIRSLIEGKDEYAMRGVKVFGFDDQMIVRTRALLDQERRRESAAAR